MIFTAFWQAPPKPAAPRHCGALTIRANSRDDAADFALRKVLRTLPDCPPDHVQITSVFSLSEISQCTRPSS